MLKCRDPVRVLNGHRETWQVTKRHVYRRGTTFKALAKRWHPDVAGRDTTAEMQIVLRFRT